MIKVLLVDDHSVVRAGFRRLLEATGQISVVAEAGDGEQGCLLAAEHQPDVTVLDLSLPGIGGLEALRRIKARNSAARVLVFSMHDNPLLVERALQAGASGYLSKASSSALMLEAVIDVHDGKRYLGPDVAKTIALGLGGGSDTGFGDLSHREFEVFRLLVEGNGTKTIADILHLSAKTVANHITSIKRKLAVDSSAELVRVALRQGLIQDYHD